MRTLMLWPSLMLSACVSAAEPVRACTKIGCSNGLAVEVTSSVQQSLNVSVRSGAAVIHTFRCDAGQPCRAFIENQTPADVSVTVDVAGAQVSKSYQPDYQLTRPNGPDCEPVCRQGQVTVTVS